jgi:hypothetical protein
MIILKNFRHICLILTCFIYQGLNNDGDGHLNIMLQQIFQLSSIHLWVLERKIAVE